MKIMKGNKMNNTNNEDLDKNIALEQMIDDFSSNMNTKKRGKTRIERKYDKYSKKFKDKFGRDPYIVESSGSREQTIEAIKICLKENKDILDKLLYPNSNKFIY